MQAQQQSNGQGAAGNKPQRRRITNHLDALEDILESSDSNSLLQNTDLGQGNYDEDYLWQQIRSYRHGLFADTAFGDLIKDRHMHETIMALGREGYNAYYDEIDPDANHNVKIVDRFDPDDGIGDDGTINDEYLERGMLPRDPQYCSSWTLFEARGRAVWQELGEANQVMSEEQAAALQRKSDYDKDWLPIWWQMVEGRHEASRSLESKLIKYVLGDVREQKRIEGNNESGSILPGKS